MSGDLTKSTISGVATYSSLKVLSSGLFQLTGTSPGLDPVNSSSFRVSSELKSITLSASPTSVELYTNFDITINLVGEDNSAYLASAEVTLTTNDATAVTISSTNPSSTTSGTIAFTIQAIKSGSFSFTAAVTGKVITSNTLSMTFLVPKLRLTVNGAVIFI